MKQTLTFFFFLFFMGSHTAQTLKAYQKATTKAMAEEDYYAAMIYLTEAMEIEPESPPLRYQYAEVCRKFHAYDLAEEYYTKLIENGHANQFPLSYFWLAKTKKSLGKYQEALDLFKTSKTNQSSDNQHIAICQNEIKACQWAMNLKENDTINTTIIHLDKKVNTPYSEFAAVMEKDQLFYTSHRYTNKEDKHKPPRNISKNLYTKKGSKGRPMKRSFNVPEKLTAHHALDTKKNRIYFTICEYVGAAKIRCTLVYREKDSRGRWKKKYKKLPKSINGDGKTATHPSVGYDSTLQKEVLFFVSDKPGGQGKLDIWYSVINEKSFGEPVNLTHINTPEDDLTPSFHTPSQALYFSSNGHKNMGGYDVFQTNKRENWGDIQHLGVPVNSSYHDLYYSLNEDGQQAYFSSNRPGSFYLDRANKTCCYDIYQADFQTVEPIPVDSGDVAIELPTPEPTLPPTPPVPTKLEDFLPLALYFHNDEPDRRTRRTTTKKDYQETYLKYYRLKQEYLTTYTAPLGEEAAFAAEIRLDDFFEEEIKKGYEHLFLFSNILLKRLEAGEKVEIFIKGYTSPRAKGDYNLRLGKRRISSLRNHFSTYQNGIFKPYLEKGTLTVTERSFGETTASTAISDDLNDKRNSIYSVEAAKERRVEIVEIQRTKN